MNCDLLNYYREIPDTNNSSQNSKPPVNITLFFFYYYFCLEQLQDIIFKTIEETRLFKLKFFITVNLVKFKYTRCM